MFSPSVSDSRRHVAFAGSASPLVLAQNLHNNGRWYQHSLLIAGLPLPPWLSRVSGGGRCGAGMVRGTANLYSDHAS